MTKINNLAELLALLSGDWSEQITNQCKMGDPDWVLDMISEVVDNIKPENTCYFPEFHGVLYEHGLIDTLTTLTLNKLLRML